MKIDQELRSLIPPLTTEECQQLEANILADGIREPLVTWQGTLIDGHNRFAIAKKHGLDYQTVEKEFADRDAVIDWMICNQLGRRNLNPNQQSYLRGLQYEREKKKPGAPEGNQNAEKQIGQNDPVVSTAERLATIHGVSAPTIKRDAEYAKNVDAIAINTSPEIKQKILSREIPMTKKDTDFLARLTGNDQSSIIHNVVTGEIKNVGQAIKQQAESDPELKRIDREHHIQNMVLKSLDICAGASIGDYEEAMEIYMRWSPDWKPQEIADRADASIVHLQKLKAAALSARILRAVK